MNYACESFRWSIVINAAMGLFYIRSRYTREEAIWIGTAHAEEALGLSVKSHENPVPIERYLLACLGSVFG